jgi:signal peptidase I
VSSAASPGARTPSRIVAGLISLIAPGIGHVYAGYTRRGLTLIAAYFVLQAVLIAAAMLMPARALAVALLLIAVFGGSGLVFLFAVIDAVRLARRGPGQRWYIWCGAMLLMWLVWYAASLLGPVIKALASWESYTVASKSMEPTLRAGERFIGDKTHYAGNAPARGDVAIYRMPSDNRTLYVHRIVALGGDRIAFREGHAVVNGVVATEPFADFGNPRAFYGNTAEVAVPAGRFFVAGDNRANATDSRVPQVGPVPVANLVARVTDIVMSGDTARLGLWVGSPR